MIGGHDVTFPFAHSGQRGPLLEAAVRSIRRHWKTAVLEGADGSAVEFHRLPFERVKELFVYRDQAALDDWNAYGATPNNERLMIHLLTKSDSMTIVVGAPDESTARHLLAEMQSQITNRMDRAA